MSYREVIFSKKQGSGYIAESPTEFEATLTDKSFKLVDQDIVPGQETDLCGFFTRPFLFVGIKEGAAIFRIGDFNGQYYYQSVYIIGPNRIFLIYQPNPIAGRDYIYINNTWK